MWLGGIHGVRSDWIVAGCKCLCGVVGCSYVCIVVTLVAVEMILLANVLDSAADRWLANVWYKMHFPFHS